MYGSLYFYKISIFSLILIGLTNYNVISLFDKNENNDADINRKK